MIDPILRSKIHNRLSSIKSQSITAVAIKKELNKGHADYFELVKTVKDCIKDNQQEMEIIMGADYVVFFKKLCIGLCK